MATFITGLDIGSSHIRGVVATPRKDGKLSILSVFQKESSGIRKGVIVDVEEATRTLRQVVLDAQSISRKAMHYTFVNVQSEHTKVRSSRGIVAVARADQEIHSDDIDRVVEASRAVKMLPNHVVLHNIIREYFVDDVGDIADPLGMTGSRLEVSTLIVEAFAPQVSLLVKTLERVGVRVGGLVFNPLASARAVLSKRQKDLGVLLVDFGFGTTSLAVFEENKVLHTKSIPIGSGYITNDIAIGLKTSVDAAEKLKVNYGFAVAKDIPRREMITMSEVDPTNQNEISRRFLAEIIEVRLAEILDLINNELKVLGRTVQLPGGVVITGGAVKLPGMDELLRQELKLSVQVGFPNLEGFEVTNASHMELIDDPAFATAVGLVRWADAEEGEQQHINVGAIKSFFKNLMP